MLSGYGTPGNNGAGQFRAADAAAAGGVSPCCRHPRRRVTGIKPAMTRREIAHQLQRRHGRACPGHPRRHTIRSNSRARYGPDRANGTPFAKILDLDCDLIFLHKSELIPIHMRGALPSESERGWGAAPAPAVSLTAVPGVLGGASRPNMRPRVNVPYTVPPPAKAGRQEVGHQGT